MHPQPAPVRMDAIDWLLATAMALGFLGLIWLLLVVTP